MASRKTVAEVPPTPKASRTLTLGFGPMAFRAAIAPLRSGSTAPKGHYVCPIHGTQLKQQYVCGKGTDEEHAVEERALAFEYGDQLVQLAPGDLEDIEDDSDPVLSLTHAADSVDPVWFEKTYMLWPHEVGPSSAAYDLLAECLLRTGKVLLGTVRLWKRSQLTAIRWSDATATLVLHVCAFDEQMRWSDVARVSTGIVARERPDKAFIELTTQFLTTLEDGVPKIVDEYSQRLHVAVETAATGGIFETKKREKAPAPAALEGMMDALKAEVAKHATATKKTTRKRARA